MPCRSGRPSGVRGRFATRAGFAAAGAAGALAAGTACGADVRGAGASAWGWGAGVFAAWAASGPETSEAAATETVSEPRRRRADDDAWLNVSGSDAGGRPTSRGDSASGTRAEPTYKPALEERWKPYLDGRGTRDEALAALVAKLRTPRR
jgi:hypothetical protein